MTSTLTEPVALGGDVSNAGAETISASLPYRVAVTVTGTADILWHRWQSDAIEAKAKASKGSAAKKSDDVESYVYRDGAGTICLPGEYLRGSLVDPRNGAAKYMQDPRSPRKSALDLFKAAVVPLTALAPIIRADGEPATAWDYLDRRRVTVQRAGITMIGQRVRLLREPHRLGSFFHAGRRAHHQDAHQRHLRQHTLVLPQRARQRRPRVPQRVIGLPPPLIELH